MRSRKDIEATINAMDYADHEPLKLLQVELLLDTRDLLTEIRDLLKGPKLKVSADIDFEHSYANQDGNDPTPEKDELYDKVMEWLHINDMKGAILSAHHLTAAFDITQGRASDLREALLAAGVLEKDPATHRYTVV